MAHIQEKQIVYRGEKIKLVRRPHMKNIRVRISRPEGEIVVSCPYGVPNSQWQWALEGGMAEDAAGSPTISGWTAKTA